MGSEALFSGDESLQSPNTLCMDVFDTQAALAAIKARQTDADIAAAEALNAEGRARLDPGSTTERRRRAAAQEEDMRKQVAFLLRQPDGPLREGRLKNAYNRIAELAAEQGDHERAAVIAQSPQKVAEYATLLQAIRAPDDQECACEPDLIVDRENRTEFREPAMTRIATIVGPEGQELGVDRCRRCGFMNAR